LPSDWQAWDPLDGGHPRGEDLQIHGGSDPAGHRVRKRTVASLSDVLTRYPVFSIKDLAINKWFTHARSDLLIHAQCTNSKFRDQEKSRVFVKEKVAVI
jgi:hypothetical protein